MSKIAFPQALALTVSLVITGGILSVADIMHTNLYASVPYTRLDANHSCGALESALHGLANGQGSCARVG